MCGARDRHCCCFRWSVCAALTGRETPDQGGWLLMIIIPVLNEACTVFKAALILYNPTVMSAMDNTC